MQPIVTTDADYQTADAETGSELLRLRREKVVMMRRIVELEQQYAESLERLRELAQREPEGDG